MGTKLKICEQCGQERKIGATKSRCKACRKLDAVREKYIAITGFLCGCHHNHASPQEHAEFWGNLYSKRKKKITNRAVEKAEKRSRRNKKKRGKKNKKPFGFRTPKYRVYIKSPAWQARRKQWFDKFGWHCQRCGSTKSLQLHHLHYRTLGRERDQDLEGLCGICHGMEHGIADPREVDPMTSEFLAIAKSF